ncbi:hypothetical protein [Ferrimonas sp. YFM]|nr:hypothetical protein [Ferrimonas sp. YFM]
MSEYGLTVEQQELMLQKNLKKLLDEASSEEAERKLFAIQIQQRPPFTA